MGMTDAQWKSHLRALIAELKRALVLNPNNDVLREMIARYELDLES
jgi:ribosomal protein S6